MEQPANDNATNDLETRHRKKRQREQEENDEFLQEFLQARQKVAKTSEFAPSIITVEHVFPDVVSVEALHELLYLFVKLFRALMLRQLASNAVAPLYPPSPFGTQQETEEAIAAQESRVSSTLTRLTSSLETLPTTNQKFSFLMCVYSAFLTPIIKTQFTESSTVVVAYRALMNTLNRLQQGIPRAEQFC